MNNSKISIELREKIKKMEAEDLLDRFAQDEGFGNWDAVVLNCHHSVIRSIAIAAVNQALNQTPIVGKIEQLKCECEEWHGWNLNGNCAECDKPKDFS